MKISDKKIQKIFEQILYYLYSINPKATYTSYIAEEIARDEEFVKKLLFELKSKNLIIEIKKNKHGKDYSRRSRWKLSLETYNIYSNKQK
jgi:predicted transcriptional regulator with HTH domain